VSYSDWGDSFQELYDTTPGTDALEDHERGYVEDLFDIAFTHSAEEYDAMGLSPDVVEGMRDEFFDYMGMDEADFDWEGWREAMGYE
jgi:hypothetical protein